MSEKIEGANHYAVAALEFTRELLALLSGGA
jgi:hypothetical protein